MSRANHQKYFAIVPAAGVGSRMGSDLPKQYLTLHNKTILEYTLSKLLQMDVLEKVVVAVSAEDQRWQSLGVFDDSRLETAIGGVERSDSVYAGLEALSNYASENDWVLVHDVARPCVRQSDIEELIERMSDDPVGGILAIPVSDTVKQVGGQQIEKTVDRSVLWLAQTPQMFRYGQLKQALSDASNNGVVITDEASAIEWAGATPKVVEGSRDNIKVTCPEDLALAAFFLDGDE